MMMVVILVVMMIKYAYYGVYYKYKAVFCFCGCIDAILTMMVSDDDDARLGTCDVCME